MNGYAKKFEKSPAPNLYWDEDNVIPFDRDLAKEGRRPVLHGELEINGIRLAIPPSDISIVEQNFNHSYQTLRTRESTKVRSGYSRISASFSAYFTGANRMGIAEDFGDRRNSSLATINGTLMPILYSLKKFPLCFIENELIRRALPVQFAEREWVDPISGARHRYITGENIGMFLRSVNVSTVDGLPETLMASFEFVWYNHRPFAHRLKFRRNWLDENGLVEQVRGIYENMSRAQASHALAKAAALKKNPDDRTSPDLHVGRAAFLQAYGHPSVAFNAAARDNWTNHIVESRPFLEWMWPYKFESSNPATPSVDVKKKIYTSEARAQRHFTLKDKPFNMSSFDSGLEFEFTILETPQKVTIDGAEVSIHRLLQDINVGAEIEDLSANTISSSPPGVAPKTVADIKARVATSKQRWGDIVNDAARNAGIDPNIIFTIMAIESGGAPDAYNKKSSAAGLMQITNPTGQIYGLRTKEERLDPAKNVDAAARMLAELLRRYNGNLQDVIWAYHMGDGGRGIQQRALQKFGLDPNKPVALSKDQTDQIPETHKQRLFAEQLGRVAVYQEKALTAWMDLTGQPFPTGGQEETKTLTAGTLPVSMERARLIVDTWLDQYKHDIETQIPTVNPNDLQKVTSLKAVLDRMDAQGARLETNYVTGKTVEIKTVTLAVPSNSPIVVPQAVSMGFGNNLVSIPLQGHRFPTVQYVGGQHTSVSMSLRCEGQLGRDFYADLVGLTAAAESGALAFREFTRKRPIGIRNPMINSINIYEVLIEDMATGTIAGSPDGIMVNLNMIDATLNAEGDPLLTPGGLESSVEDTQLKLLSLLIERGWIKIASIKLKDVSTTTSSAVDGGRRSGGGTIASAQTTFRQALEVKLEASPPFDVATIVGSQLRTLVNYMNEELDEAVPVNAQVMESTRGLKRYNQSAFGLMNAQLLQAPLSGPVGYGGIMLTGESLHDPRAIYAIIGSPEKPGILSTGKVKVALATALEKMIGVLGVSRNGQPALDADFAKLVSDLSAPLAFLPGHEAYPDLDLPLNPITGLKQDTTPDFFLYNESDVKFCHSAILDLMNGQNDQAPKAKGLRMALHAIEGTHQGVQQVYGIIPQSQLKQGEVSDVAMGRNGDYGRSNKGQFATGARVNGEGAVIETFQRTYQGKDKSGGYAHTGFVSGREGAPAPIMKTDIDVRKRGIEDKYEQSKSHLFHNQNKVLPGVELGEFAASVNRVGHIFDKQEYRSLFSQFTKNYQGDHLSIRRSFPTFKVFFIDEEGEVSANTDDKVDAKLFRAIALDDFYGVNSIKSIRIVEQKDMAAGSCIIEVLDLDGILYNRKYLPENSKFGLRDSSNARARKSPFSNTVIKEGMKVLIKFGYSNDPDQLEPVFVGQIAQFEGHHLVEIICQSYGTELVAKRFGTDASQNAGFWNSSTAEMLHDCMDREELRHFGRWRLQDINPLGFTGFIGYQKLRPDGQIKKAWTWKPSVVDDNLYIPDISQYADRWDRFWGNIKYVYWDTTIWNVFKECELRHPGYVAYPKIYGGSPLSARMTMFFGNPSMEYLAGPATTASELEGEIGHNNMSSPDLRASIIWWGDPLKTSGFSEVEAYYEGLKKIAAQERIINALAAVNNRNLGSGRALMQKDLIGHFGQKQVATHLDNLSLASPYARQILNSIRTEILSSPESEGYDDPNAIPPDAFWKATMVFQKNRMKTFRRYELATSLTDIVSNNIRSDHRDTFNSVELRYSDGSVDFEDFHGEGTAETITINADDNIQEHHIRRTVESWINCTSEDLALRYSAQLLANSLKKVYKGELILLGKPHIKPYDIIWLADTYSDMAGPIEVDEVVHSFSAETGFITEIVPAMIVAVKEETTTLMADACGTFFNETIKEFWDGFQLGLTITGVASLGRGLALHRVRGATAIREGADKTFKSAEAALRAASKARKELKKAIEVAKKKKGTEAVKPSDIKALEDKLTDIRALVKKNQALRVKAHNELNGVGQKIIDDGFTYSPGANLLGNAIAGAALAAVPYIYESGEEPEDSGITQQQAGFLAGAGLGAVAMINPLVASAAVIGAGLLTYKFIKYGLMREPIIITPLLKQGKPYVTGIDGFESDGLVIADLFSEDAAQRDKAREKMIYKKWRYYFDGIEDAADIISAGWARFRQI